MKLKALLMALFVAGLVVSMAVAAPAEKGKGKNGTTAAESTSTGGSTAGTTTTSSGKSKGKKHGTFKQAGCKPNRSVVAKGTFVGAGAGGFAMTVTRANRHGRSLVGKQVTVLVGDGTKFRKRGKASLADLEAGDRLNVQGRACKLDQQAMTLVAKRVVAHPPSGDDGDEQDEDEGTTSTSTGTTETTTTGTTTTSTTTTS